MQTAGTFAPWSNQFEAMAYVSWAIILGYGLLELRYKIKAVGAFVVGIGFIAMGAASLLPYRYQTAEPLVPALNSYWIYIHMSITLTSYAAFAMAGGLGVIREIVSGPRDWTRLDSLQVLTKWINVTPKAADAQQSDRGARKG